MKPTSRRFLTRREIFHRILAISNCLPLLVRFCCMSQCGPDVLACHPPHTISRVIGDLVFVDPFLYRSIGFKTHRNHQLLVGDRLAVANCKHCTHHLTHHLSSCVQTAEAQGSPRRRQRSSNVNHGPFQVLRDTPKAIATKPPPSRIHCRCKMDQAILPLRRLEKPFLPSIAWIQSHSPEKSFGSTDHHTAHLRGESRLN